MKQGKSTDYYTKVMEAIYAPIYRELPLLICCLFCLGCKGLYDHTIVNATLRISESFSRLGAMFIVSYIFILPVSLYRAKL